MEKIYERPKLVIIGIDNIDVITTSTFNEQKDNAIENPWSMGDIIK